MPKQKLALLFLPIAISLIGPVAAKSASGTHSLADRTDSAAIAQAESSNRINPDTIPTTNLDELTQQMLSLYEQNRYEEAIAIAQTILTIREVTQGSDHPDVGTILGILGTLYRLTGSYAAAEPVLVRAIGIKENALGEAHLEVAAVLNALGNVYQAQGRLSEALPLYQRTLSIREAAYGESHPDIASSLKNLAGLYREQGNYADAFPLYELALAMQIEALGEDHPDVGGTLLGLAGLYQATGDYEAALSHYQRTLSIWEDAFGEDDPRLGYVLNGLGTLYQEQGDFSASLPLYQRTLSILTETFGENHPQVATTLNNIAFAYKNQGDYEAALPLYQRALAIRKNTLGDTHPETAIGLTNIAELYQVQGDYAAALPMFEQALAIWRQSLGETHPQVSVGLNNLASAYSSKGEYTKALPLYEQALALAKESLGETHPRVADGMNNLAYTYALQGNYEAALPLYQRAVDIWESLSEDHPMLPTGLGNLAGEYSRRGDIERAIALYDRAIATAEDIFGEDHPQVATVINNKAVLELKQQRYSAAIPLLERALTITRSNLEDNHPDVATLLSNLASAYQADGDYETALSLAEQALSVSENALGEHHPVTATSLKTLGLVYWDMGELDRTSDLLTRMSTIEETLLSDTLLSASEVRRQRYINTLAPSTSLYVSAHINANPSSEKAAQLAMNSLLRRKGRVLDAVSGTSQSLRQDLPPEQQQQLDKLNLLRTQLANLRFDGLGDKTIDQYQSQLRSLEREAEQIEEALARYSAEFAIATDPISTEAVQSHIPEAAALVEFVRYQTYLANSQQPWGEVRYAAYIMTKQGNIEAVDLGEAEIIDRLLETFRESLTTRSANHKTIARQLDEQLIAPIRPFLADKSHLLLSPDSQLNLIPFDALVVEQDEYLIERYQISYLNSGRDLLKLQTKAPSRQASVVIADPSYEGSASSVGGGQRSVDADSLYFGELPGTAAEGSAIASLLPSSTLLTQQQATESALKQISAPGILHIATHGFFLPDVAFVVPDADSRAASFSLIDTEAPTQITSSNLENPLLRSGLAFAGANNRSSDGEDGIFTALEASGLDLYGTKLVVLSACETGVGAASSGEGVYGLRRAFAIAGAESQLMSLWQVSDAGTSELMQLYYKNLIEKKQGRSEALRNAQLELLNTGTYQHPYYWSSFILSGDWLPLE